MPYNDVVSLASRTKFPVKLQVSQIVMKTSCTLNSYFLTDLTVFPHHSLYLLYSKKYFPHSKIVGLYFHRELRGSYRFSYYLKYLNPHLNLFSATLKTEILPSTGYTNLLSLVVRI